MPLLKEIKHLIAKELTLEWRQQYALGGILLYVVSTVFVAYMSFKFVVQPAAWNALFWIILLFASANAVAKSFMQESRGRLLYYYTLVSPQAVILSKVIYNTALLIVIGFITYFIYSLFIGSLVQDKLFFIISLVLGAMGFASAFTMVSAIASKVGNNATLMAILSFPVILPMLITLIKFSKNAIDGLDRSVSYQYIGILLLLNLVTVILAYLLFPYLWRE